MHVALDSAEVLLVVRGTDAASRRAAVALIQEADPASTGVPMRDLHQIHLDVKLNGGTVHFATNLKASPCLRCPVHSCQAACVAQPHRPSISQCSVFV